MPADADRLTFETSFILSAHRGQLDWFGNIDPRILRVSNYACLRFSPVRASGYFFLFKIHLL